MLVTCQPVSRDEEALQIRNTRVGFEPDLALRGSYFVRAITHQLRKAKRGIVE